MGVLEDAIREHLELKRQHGASEEELTNQEEEALGPARRDVATAEAEAEAAEQPFDQVVPAEVAPEEIGEVAPGEIEEVAPDEIAEVAPEESPLTETVPAPAEPAEFAPAEPAELAPETAVPPAEPDDVRFDEEEPGVAPPMPAPAGDEPEPAGGEPEPAAEEDAEGENEDVLEETPDFLQETPEHDRLWFEQKPPRDFDFD